jgi:hypothetical protein
MEVEVGIGRWSLKLTSRLNRSARTNCYRPEHSWCPVWCPLSVSGASVEHGSKPTLACGTGQFGEVGLHAAGWDAEGFIVELQAGDLSGLDEFENEGIVHA